MSRWHVVSVDEPNLRVQLGHACYGAHSPNLEWVTADTLPRNDLWEKPTLACVCGEQPHLPGPSDRFRDLVPGELDRWLAEIVRDWTRQP